MNGCGRIRCRLVAIGLAAGLGFAGAATADTAPGQAGARVALTEPAVALRFGVHPGYDRLVLEWPEPVKANIASERGVATLRFDRPASLSVSRLDRLVSEDMRPVRLAADGRTLTFRIPPGRRLVDHSSGNLVVIDLVTGAIEPPAPAEAAAASASPVPPPAAPGPTALAGSAAPAAVPESAAAPAEPAPVVTEPMHAVPDQAPPAPASASAEPAPVITEPMHAVPDEVPPAPPPASAEIAAAESAAEQEAVAAAPLEPLPDPSLIGETTDHSLQVRTTPLDDGFSLRFEWSRPVGAAVFQLGSTAWVVFDHAVRLHMNPLPTDAARAVTMMQAPNISATVLRVVMPPNDRLIVGRAGNIWLVDIRRPPSADTISEAPSFTPLRPNHGFYATPDPGRPVTVVDADTGEVLIAVPLPTAGQGFDQTLDYKSYHAVTTAQGLLFRPQTDAIQFEIVQGGVRVVTPPPNTLATQ